MPSHDNENKDDYEDQKESPKSLWLLLDGFCWMFLVVFLLGFFYIFWYKPYEAKMKAMSHTVETVYAEALKNGFRPKNVRVTLPDIMD